MFKTFLFQTKADIDLTSILSPLKAIEQFQKVPFDVLITDYKMPVLNGLELIRWLKVLHPYTFFIMLSSVKEKIIIQQAYQAGIYYFVQKMGKFSKIIGQVGLILTDIQKNIGLKKIKINEVQKNSVMIVQ